MKPVRPNLVASSLLTLAALLCTAWYARDVAAPFARGRTFGFPGYYTAAQTFVHSPELFAKCYEWTWFPGQLRLSGFPHVHEIWAGAPPSACLIAVPLVGLRPDAARAVFTFASIGILLLGLWLMARALRVPALAALWALPLVLLLAPVSQNVEYGQAYIIVFFLQACLLHGSVREREERAGIALGFMVGLKGTGGWQALLFALSRRFRLLAAAAATVSLLVVGTVPVIGISPWRAFARSVPEVLAFPRRTVLAYQTVTSLVGHLLARDPEWNPDPALDAPVLARLLPLAVAAFTLVVTWRLAHLRHPDPDRRALGFALALSLSEANAPLGEGYHYAAIVPALLVAFWWAYRNDLWWPAWLALAPSTLLIGLPFDYSRPDLRAGWNALLAYPRVYGAFLLWGWLAWCCRCPGVRPPAGSRPC